MRTVRIAQNSRCEIYVDCYDDISLVDIAHVSTYEDALAVTLLWLRDATLFSRNVDMTLQEALFPP